MRRFLILLCMATMLCLPAAGAEDVPWDTITAAVDAINVNGLTQDVQHWQVGPWLSVQLSLEGFIAPRMEGIQYYGLVFGLPQGERITWADVFTDGDAAADHIEAVARTAVTDNAYAEYTEVSPVPRDSFIIADNQLTVYYPATQLSSFSGRSGGISLYAYELEGLLAPQTPLYPGDLAQAAEAVTEAMNTGALPGTLSAYPIGTPMQAADDAFGVEDVPDFDGDWAVWRFEAPQMRGVTLLSVRSQEDVETAAIAGIHADRMDIGGMQTGRTTIDACREALASLALEHTAVSPQEETLQWTQQDKTLTFSFVDGVLTRISLMLANPI